MIEGLMEIREALVVIKKGRMGRSQSSVVGRSGTEVASSVRTLWSAWVVARGSSMSFRRTSVRT